jgi:regulator of sigma E protease
MPDLLSNAIAFIFALGVIIFVHEAGHLLVAKFFDTRVLKFSLGFGKRIWGFERGETDYRVSLIPLGGYVLLGGENPDEVSDDPRDFLNKPRWQRILVYLAGPAMNILLSIILIAGLFMIGISVPMLQSLEPIVGYVEEGSAGDQAGIETGDRVLRADGDEVDSWEDVQFALMTSPERPVVLSVERAGRQLEIPVTPVKVPKYEFGDAGLGPQYLPRVTQVNGGSPAESAGFRVGDELRSVDGRPISSSTEFVGMIQSSAGRSVEVFVARDGETVVLTVVPEGAEGAGLIGIGIGVLQRYGPLRAVVESVKYNVDIARQTFAVVGKIITGNLTARSISGPIEIAAMSGAAARSGFDNLIYLMGLISISIAILNLLPIPVLDGGQIFILLIESLRRKDLSLRVKERIQQVGFYAIVMLMVVVLYFDLVKNIPDGLLPGS